MDAKAEKLEGANSPKEKQTETWNATTVVALIGAIATITVALISALFAFPPFIALFQTDPTFTPTVTPATIPTSFTDTPSPLVAFPSITETPELSGATPVATSTIILPSTATKNPSQPAGMNIQLIADKTSGKTPLIVKFDARGSFLRAPDGTIYPCRGGPCNYTWEVYKGNQRIGRPTKNSTGVFDYKFEKKGTYFVRVTICRGLQNSDCAGSSVPIAAE